MGNAEKKYAGLALVICAGFVTLGGNSMAWGQAHNPATKPGPAPKPVTTKPAADPIIALQAKAWGEFYLGRYKESGTSADNMLANTQEQVKWEAQYLQARCMFALGDVNGAKALWAQLERTAGKIASRQARVKMAGAIQTAADKDLTKASKAAAVFEDILRDGGNGLVNAEAALELATLQTRTGHFEEAKKALAFLKSLLAKENLTRLEIADSIAKAFRDAGDRASRALELAMDAGREEWDKAEAMRKGRKFVEAIVAYQAIVKEFPGTDYAPRSLLAIGTCHLELEKPLAAIEQWKTFVASSPAGAWRGQAYIGLIDLQLENQLDAKEAAKYADMAMTAIETALADEKLAASWKLIANDLQLRLGTVAFLTGKAEAAAKAFESAKSGRDKETVEGLDALIEAAKAGKGVIPSDVASKTGVGGMGPVNLADKSTVALSMGIMYKVAKKYDLAEGFFDRVLQDKLLKPRTEQSVFALFGKSLISFTRGGKSKEIIEQLTAVMKAAPDASFNDESLYMIASLITKEADAAHKKAEYEVKHNESDKPAGIDELKKLKEAERERKVAHVKAKSEALPYWQEILKRHSQSSKSAIALYATGVIEFELAELSDDPNSENLWKQAGNTLTTFTDKNPLHAKSGDAYLKQIDIALERLFEEKRAQAISDLMIAWLKNDKEAEGINGRKLCWEAQLPEYSFASEAKELKVECYLKAGFIAYLMNDKETARSHLQQADPAKIGKQPGVNPSFESMGVRLLLSYIENSKDAWDATALKLAKSPQQATALKLADCYLVSERTTKAFGLFQRILSRDPLCGNASSDLASYLQLRLGLAHTRSSSELAAKQFALFYNAPYKESPWAAESIVLLGILTFNQTQDPKKALPHYEHVLNTYPDNPATKKALYFAFLNVRRMGNQSKMQEYGQEFLRKYPNDIWSEEINQLMTPSKKE